MFVHDNYQHIFLHYIFCFDCDLYCELCRCGNLIICLGTGRMLKNLLIYYDRFLAGSDCASIQQGQMTPAMAKRILQNKQQPYDLYNLLTEFFPGLDLIQHMGGDLFYHYHHYALFLKHSNDQCLILSRLYQNRRNTCLKQHLRASFFLMCAYLTGSATLNINTSWSLPAITLLHDTLFICMR